MPMWGYSTLRFFTIRGESLPPITREVWGFTVYAQTQTKTCHVSPKTLQYDTAVKKMKIKQNKYEEMKCRRAVKFLHFNDEHRGINSLKEVRRWADCSC